MSEILCPQCKAPNRSNARYCSECGASLAGASMGIVSQPAAEPPSQAPDDPATHPTSSAPVESQRTLLERYRIEKELGRGGFGAVYKAWDNNLSRRCALKENLDTSPDAQRQFLREATVLANLSHPNLPRVTDHFSIPGQGQYLVMDFVDGEDLASLLHREGRVSVARAVDWIAQAADALDYLHTRQPSVLHRDIKPANIRLTPEGRVMLVDFGLVKMYDPLLKTTMGARAVTPGYAPPEQYGMGRTDARSDIYALGATLYKLLTGQEPMESVLRASGGRMAPASALNPAVPPAISQAIETAMSLDPSRRFQSAAEFKTVLVDGLKPAPAAAGRSEVVQVTPGKVSLAAPAVSAPPAGRSRAPGGVSADRTGAAAHENRLPGSGAPGQGSPVYGTPVYGTPVYGTTGQSAAVPSAPVKRPAWLWWGVGGAVVLVLVLCLGAGGGLMALLNGDSNTPTPRAASPVALEASTPPTVPSAETPPVILAAASDTPAAPTATSTPAPTSTPDPRFLSKDSSSFVYAGLGLPDTLDPALDYETSGMAVIHNIYETLIWYQRESPTAFIPQLAVEVPSEQNGLISPDGKSYTFHIRPGVRFQDGSPLTVDDVAYSFQRGILQGGSTSPQWLFTEPLLGVGTYDVAALVDPALVDRPADLKQADPGKLQAACQRVVDAVTADSQAGTVTFHLAQPWGPFLATLANGWSAVRSKAWTIANGGWDGNCASWQNFYGRLAADLNQTALGAGAMGTGPYKLDHWTAGKEIVLKANPDYWRTEAAWQGGPSGPARLQTITILYVPNLQEQVAMLRDGRADAIETESNADWPSLDPLTGMDCNASDQACQPTAASDAPLERIHGVPAGGREQDITFNWQINTQGGNALIGSGTLDGAGVPPDFFANVHVRRAFAYCFNYDRYLSEILQGEGIRAVNLMLAGMIGYDSNSPYYTYDPQTCADELRQAQFDGRSVWEAGFRLKLPYNDNSNPRAAIAKIFEAEFTALDSRFQVQAQAVKPEDYARFYAENRLPYTTVGWVEDIHDPHNWVYPYTLGNLGRWQNMPADLTSRFQQLISQAVQETDPANRAAIYRQFNQLYYDQAPAVLLFQTVTRRYQQRWVNGWYGNPLFPGLYYYALWKN